MATSTMQKDEQHVVHPVASRTGEDKAAQLAFALGFLSVISQPSSSADCHRPSSVSMSAKIAARKCCVGGGAEKFMHFGPAR